MADWQGRVALVSGASAGIGAATAEALAAKGCAVTLLARRRDRLDAVADRLRLAGGRVHVVVGDVTADDDVARAVDETLAAFGNLDIVIANAGAGFHGSLLDTSPDAMARLPGVPTVRNFLRPVVIPAVAAALILGSVIPAQAQARGRAAHPALR